MSVDQADKEYREASSNQAVAQEDVNAAYWEFREKPSPGGIETLTAAANAYLAANTRADKALLALLAE